MDKTTRLTISVIFGALCIAVIMFVSLRHAPPAEVKEVVTPKVYEPQHQVIGFSTEGRPIEAYTYSPLNEEVKPLSLSHIVFIGGIHGGYEWNSVLLAYTAMDYLKANPETIPKNVVVTIIPSANPDGVFKILNKEGRFALTDVPKEAMKNEKGLGRFNSNDVDLNRNFDCKWHPKSSWKGNAVSAGTKAFSEPESQALRDFLTKTNPDGVVFWHSQANAVYASECEDGILPVTRDIMNAYAKAADYKSVDTFDAYPVTGDAEGWLASIGIPAITVELSTHEIIEWDKNLKGIQALFEYFNMPHHQDKL
jgi:hypothetical protein